MPTCSRGKSKRQRLLVIISLIFCLLSCLPGLMPAAVKAAQPAACQVCSVQPDKTFQSIDGFGAGFNGNRWLSALNDEDRQHAYDLLYGEQAARLNIIRLTISPGAAPVAGNYGSPPHYNWAADQETGSTWQAIKPVLARTHPLIYAVPFSPPARWKDNNQLVGGGSLRPEFYGDYALYLADFLDYYRSARGVNINVLSLQNEPGIAARWQSCLWTGTQLRDFLKILGPVLSKRGLSPALMLSEGTAWSGAWTHLLPALQDPQASRFLQIIASHSYGDPLDRARQQFAAASARTGMPVWMSEMSLMFPPQPDDPSINAGIHMAEFLHRDLVEAHASAWIYCFAIFTSTFQGSMGLLSPPDLPGESSGKLVVPKRFWVMCNYSRFVRPGWKLMQITDENPDHVSRYFPSGTTAVAENTVANAGFVSPQKDRFTIIALNRTGQSHLIKYDFGSHLISKLESFETSANCNLYRREVSTLNDHCFSAVLAPASITSFVGTVDSGK